MTQSKASTVDACGRPKSEKLLGITQNNYTTREFLRLSEMHDGTFILLAQNPVGIGSFTFPTDAPEDVKSALRVLQEAMQRSNLSGFGGGVNNAIVRD